MTEMNLVEQPERFFAWGDLETTDYKPGFIVEVAFIVTDAKLNELGEFHTLVEAPPKELWNPETYSFHEEHGLIDALKSGNPRGLDDVERDLYAFIHEHVGEQPKKERERSVFLAGNSVHFDKTFLSACVPSVMDLFHYRLFDVSAMRMGMEVALGQKIELTNNATHRALDDIRGSIRLFKELWKLMANEMGTTYFGRFPWTTGD
jgi:oligoribonuclease